MKFEEMIEEYGNDWRNIDKNILMEVNLEENDLRKIIFPSNRDLFKIFKRKSIVGCIMPEMDYGCYDFEEVRIQGAKFTKKSKLPNDKEFFQKIAFKSLARVTMPYGNYEEYNFENVDIRGAKFTKDSKLPNKRNFFTGLDWEPLKDLYRYVKAKTYLPEQSYDKCSFENVPFWGMQFPANSVLPSENLLFEKLFESEIVDSSIPNGDYRTYSFKNVTLKNVKFANKVLLPERADFFEEVKKISSTTKLPLNVIENFWNYTIVENKYNMTTKGAEKLISKDFIRYAKLVGRVLPKMQFKFNENVMIKGFFGGNVYTGNSQRKIGIKSRNFLQIISRVYNSELYLGDCSEMSFDGVDLRNLNLTSENVLPDDKELFLSVLGRRIGEVSPVEDYSNYILNRVTFRKTNFTGKEKFPSDVNFLKMVRFDQCQIPKSILDNIQIYDTSGVRLDLTYNDITDTEVDILKLRAPKAIVIPPSVHKMVVQKKHQEENLI